MIICFDVGWLQWTLVMGGSLAQGRTLAMNTLVVSQCLYCLSCRYLTRSSLHFEALYTNPWLTAMIILNGALQCLVTYTPGVQVHASSPIVLNA
jgi:magnesium-transporting ATPase (P-type)